MNGLFNLFRNSMFMLVCFSLIMSLFGPTPTVSAEQGTTYRVDATSLQVRSEPSMDASVIGSLEDETIVTVYENRFGWARINYNGQSGWVAAYYLLESDSTSPHSQQVKVAGDAANIRTGPGTGYDSLGLAYRGDSFQLLEKANDWVQVRLSDGGTGWIAGWLVTSDSSQGTSHSSLEGVNIVLDAGHGGYDPGAIGYFGGYEKNLTLQTAHTISDQLQQAGANVIMTRSNDRYLALEERVDISHAYDTDAFISLHYNSSLYPSARGISTYYYSNGDKGLADQIQGQLIAHTNLQNDGAQFGDYHVLRENNDAAVLVELGFLSNPSEVGKLKTGSYQSSVAEAITQGLIDYF
ncbi:N-acetylmuramoyl-L-alanine amidase [Halobacillus shinanisalinarum]|uniref:N-acetylmuramoyl-L-alanine amidase n=1 Tax=Halobacillus shinanisalinarum TaxID=2932258 RepID=A0ABY4H3B6_9BACI|nr:N-acetylmuramoyl-L-alanine amidase [Halobacillus shinanisalinarum]UOQ94854.1 N-acetylmuramoyl-L-alanine amidase [Halobacillus shinanisalinarum]